MSDRSDRTLPASPRRRRELREQGQVAQSRLLRTAGQLLVAVVAGVFLVSHCIDAMAGMLKQGLTREIPRGGMTTEAVSGLAGELSGWAAGVVLPLMVLVAVAGILVSLLQTGFLWAPSAAAVRLNRVSFLGGLGRMFSQRSVMRLLMGVGQLAIVLCLAAWTAWKSWPGLSETPRLGPAGLLSHVSQQGLQLAGLVAVGLVMLGGLDWLYQRWDYEQGLKMTPEEWRREQRQEQGNRRVTDQHRRKHRQLVSQAAPLQAAAEPLD